ITNHAFAESIFVLNKDVYVAGYEHDGLGYTAKYWKNGQVVSLGDGSASTFANTIFIDRGNVHVVGRGYIGKMYTAALYWKNGQTVNLTDGNIPASASAVFVDNDDVYISGYEGNVAKYWKNGQAVDLTDGSHEASALSIFIAKTAIN